MKGSDFSRMLTHLRKERGISQKKAASELGVSQSLLSHYEKGIRECGLVFLVRAADFYGVTVDYLLGRSYDKSGAVISVDDLPADDAAGKGNQSRAGFMPTLNRKLICNSVTVLADILTSIDDKELTLELCNYLSISVYKMFRTLYNANYANPQTFFGADIHSYSQKADSAMSAAEAKIIDRLCYHIPMEKLPDLDQQSINENYPLFAASLFNLLQNVENKIGGRKK